jgi:hypothetical protein
MRELTQDNWFAAPQPENALTERGSCGLAQNPVGPRVWTTGYIFSEEANGTAKGDHLVNERIGAELVGVGSGVCRDKAEDGSSVAKALKGPNGRLVGARLAPLVSITGESLDAHKQDNILAPGDAHSDLGRYERAVGDREEEEAPVAGHEVEHIVPQKRLSTGDDNGLDTQLLSFGEKSIEFIC